MFHHGRVIGRTRYVGAGLKPRHLQTILGYQQPRCAGRARGLRVGFFVAVLLPTHERVQRYLPHSKLPNISKFAAYTKTYTKTTSKTKRCLDSTPGCTAPRALQTLAACISPCCILALCNLAFSAATLQVLIASSHHHFTP